jgi:hypothetical protein
MTLRSLRGCIKTSITALFVRVSNTYFAGTRAFSSSNQGRKCTQSCLSACRRECRFDTIPKLPKVADHLRRTPVRARFGDRRTAFLVGHAVVEDLPNEPTESVRNRSDGLRVAEADDQASIHDFEDAPFGLYRGVRRLIEEAPHLAIAVGRPTAVIDAGAFVVPGTGAHPRGQALRRREGGSRRADFGNDLLSGIDAQAGDGREPLDGILMLAQQLSQFLI